MNLILLKNWGKKGPSQFQPQIAKQQNQDGKSIHCKDPKQIVTVTGKAITIYLNKTPTTTY